ncbi:NAD(P)/FAD-dependent oxidoreductase [Cyclobacterium jeungdonense]|uniref:NAD(P)/FAD-dependent oxidoreductase n=1 Tax=Cyclobacterium jeungdonense TaxID=708087 RepID=A0ABT8CBN7_9BACT|nr:NAD(P)/FAD-dependent oxidoreductase [Cyclobacterium jeungdonense]MDN3690220.1 NAD(P)/FAD-dependent oxidoreductase [Cyclobacterium jeungdonense]
MTIGVVGGGAAGFFAAIHAACSGHKVILFEKNQKVLSKVLVSGGGRCNVTQGTFKNSELLKGYPRGSRFLKKVFPHFSTKDTFSWFESRGVPLKTETDGRVFPQSDDSRSVVSVLLNEANRLGVRVELNKAVLNIEVHGDGFKIEGKSFSEEVDRLIICSGGTAKREGYALMERLGHSLVPPVPSLFTFNAPETELIKLKGISVPNGQIRFEGSKLTYSGPILITHWGISGPAVLKLSAFGAKWLHNKSYHAVALIRWDEGFTPEGLATQLAAFKSKHPRKTIRKNPLFEVPARLWDFLASEAGMEEELKWEGASKKKINKLIENLFKFPLIISGKTTFKEEFVTAGGIALDEIDPNSLESKKIPGLYFAGEVMDVDGITGGYNFQVAWSTGFLAGKSSTQA